jgi:hypothetical protein
MRTMLLLFVAASLAGCQSMQSSESAKVELASAGKAWADALNQCEPARIAALYDREAVVWATTTGTIISTPEGVRQYFDRVCASPAPPKVAFGEQLVRVYGDTGINSGDYTFNVQRDGKTIAIPARYNMVYRNTAGQWLIVDHHSSPRPAPPKPQP